MSGKRSRDKGARREREMVHKLGVLGVKAERVPLSGAVKFRNTESTDLDYYPFGDNTAPWISEVKARANGEGFKTIESWLDDADTLFLIRDRQTPLVVLPWARFAELLMTVKGKAPIRMTPAIEAALQEPRMTSNEEWEEILGND